MKPLHFYFWGLLLILFLGSCNTTKHLKDGELLVKKNAVSLDAELKRSEYNSLQYQLSTLAKPKPNNKFLGFFRTRLWWHYRIAKKMESDTTQPSKFRKFMLRRVAQKPIIYNEDMALNNAKTMEYYLNNKGYFDAKVDFETDTVRKKLIKVRYIAKANQALNIEAVQFKCPDKEIEALLNELSPKTHLKVGTSIDKKRFNQEKNRITADLRNRGYIYFYPNYIYFTADSSKHLANVRVDVTPPPDAPVYPYHIGKITVHTDYHPTGSLYREDKSVPYEGFHFIKPDSSSLKIKMKPIAEAITFKTGDLYTLESQQVTNKKLNLLNVYKFISIKFTPNEVIGADGKRYLDCNIYLTPLKKMELGGDIEINSIQAQAFTGLGTFLNFNYQNRNVFRGAELFNLNATGGIEFLRNKDKEEKGLLRRNTLDIRLSSDLYFPSLSFRGAPLRASLSYNYLSRYQQFTYNLLNLASGFDFQRSQNTKVSWNFINLNYLSPTIDPLFQVELDKDPLLASSFDPQLIPQGTIDYIYTIPSNALGNSWVFHGTFEYAGFLVNALDRFTPNLDIRFGDITYSQFFRFDVDIRYTKKVRKNSWAFRFNAGLAQPYGNSRTSGIPYVKQFFAGGNSSLRAWRVRELGPGSYINYSNFYNNNAPFQTGDIKLEFNMEYRFSMKAIYSTMEGAFFTDIGNVWSLTDSDQSKRFKSNFYEELAVASGVGLRLDFDFFIVRFDLGWRMRYPYTDDNGRHWLIRPPLYSDRPFAPRAQFGIGYPF